MIYNHQLCLLDRGLWSFAVKSISDWKNEYHPECLRCNEINACGGFFFSAKYRPSDHIQAVIDTPPPPPPPTKKKKKELTSQRMDGRLLAAGSASLGESPLWPSAAIIASAVLYADLPTRFIAGSSAGAFSVVRWVVPALTVGAARCAAADASRWAAE